MHSDLAISIIRRDFVVEFARDQAALREAHKLRYQVFCVERGIFRGEHDLEFDAYDRRSHHVLLRRRANGEVVGTARLVVAAHEAPMQSFPMQRVVDAGLFRDVPVLTTGEISRFALSKHREPNRPVTCMLRLGLVRGVLELSRALGLSHWCAAMEPSLLRLLASCGIKFDTVGDAIDYHGKRHPVIGEIDGILARGREAFPHFWDYVSASGRLDGTISAAA